MKTKVKQVTNQSNIGGEIITAENIQTIAERIAIRALKTVRDKAAGTVTTAERDSQRGKPVTQYFNFIHRLYCDLCADIKRIRNGGGISDGYDIAQTAACYLCKYIGKRLDDSTTDGATDEDDKPITISRLNIMGINFVKIQYLQTDGIQYWQTDSATDKDSEPTTILRGCFRAVNRYIMGQRAKQFKTVVLDDNNGKYITPPPLWDTPTITDLIKVKKAIGHMKLSATERRILSMRMQGLSRNAIAARLSIKRQSVQVYLKRIQAKAEKIGIQPNKTAATVKL